MKYDFAGWASRNNIRCTDGRTIQQDAFKDMDGKEFRSSICTTTRM